MKELVRSAIGGFAKPVPFGTKSLFRLKPRRPKTPELTIRFNGEIHVQPDLSVMPVKKRILVPTDFSLCAAKALEHAAAMAKEWSASITLLHIVNVNPPDSYRWVGPANGHMVDLRNHALVEMRRLTESLAARDIEFHAIIQEGIPWEEIADQSGDFDLIILARGTKRRFRFFSHDTSLRARNHANCEVRLLFGPDFLVPRVAVQQTAPIPTQRAA